MSTDPNNISLFNTKVLEYLSFINNLLIDKKMKKNLITYISKIKIGLLMDNLILMNLFKKYIYIYKNEINDKNKLILNKMEEYLFENKIKITDIWDTIEEKDKETIWKYLKVFVLLCDQ